MDRIARGRPSFVIAVLLPAIALPTAAQSSDSDADGVDDTIDNCIGVPNGPLAGTGSCNAQEDADGDGYGNPCDSDFNQDGVTGYDDLSAMIITAAGISEDPLYDLNCDGGAGADDQSRVLSDAGASDLVGPPA